MELLQQVRVIDPGQQVDRLADVLIKSGKIVAIADRISDYPQEASVVAGSELVLGTGLTDLYSHSGEPGNEARETLSDLARAATAGGFTQVGILTRYRSTNRQCSYFGCYYSKKRWFTRLRTPKYSQVKFLGSLL